MPVNKRKITDESDSDSSPAAVRRPSSNSNQAALLPEQLEAVRKDRLLQNKIRYETNKEGHKARQERYLSKLDYEKRAARRRYRTEYELDRREQIRKKETPEQAAERKRKDKQAHERYVAQFRTTTGGKTRPGATASTQHKKSKTIASSQPSSSTTTTTTTTRTLSTQSIFANPNKAEVDTNYTDSHFELLKQLPLSVPLTDPGAVSNFLKKHQEKMGSQLTKYLSPPSDLLDAANLVVIDALFPCEKEGSEYFGIVAARTIERGEPLFLGTGMIVSSKNKLDEESNYITDLANFYLDSKRERSPQAFINHSVQNANAMTIRTYTQGHNTGGRQRITGFKIVATERIEKGQQIFVNYGDQFTKHLKAGRKFIYLNLNDNELSSLKIFEKNRDHYKSRPVELSSYKLLDEKFFADFGLAEDTICLMPKTMSDILNGVEYYSAHSSDDLPLLENTTEDTISPLDNYRQKNITSFMIAAYFGYTKYVNLFYDKNVNIQERQTGKSLLFYTVIGRGSTENKIKIIDQLFGVGIHISAFYNAFYAALRNADLPIIAALIKAAKPNLPKTIFQMGDEKFEYGFDNLNFKFDSAQLQEIFSKLSTDNIIKIAKAIDTISENHDVTDQILTSLENHPLYKICRKIFLSSFNAVFYKALEEADIESIKLLIQYGKSVSDDFDFDSTKLQDIFSSLAEHEIEDIAEAIDDESQGHDITDQIFGLLGNQHPAYQIYLELIYGGEANVPGPRKNTEAEDSLSPSHRMSP